jgi:hypothetical protein
MTDKKKLEDVMQQRNPLKQIVQPVDIYVSKQVNNNSKQAFELPSVPRPEKKVVVQVVKKTSDDKKPLHKIDGVLIRKYTTHLPPAMIKAVKQRALDTDRKDYEIMFDAINKYFSET